MTGGFLALCAVVLLGLLLWPGSGFIARWRRGRELAARSQHEDTLKHILKSEANGHLVTLDSIAGALQIRTGAAADLLEALEDKGLVTYKDGGLRLQPPGRELALHIVRAHRLWESYLADQTGVAEREWHHRAERQEHLLTPQETEALAARLGHPTHDPHGDAIPEPHGDLAAEDGHSLNTAAPDQPLVITHIEDEPESVYNHLLSQGLRAGMEAFVIERSGSRVRFWADGREHWSTPVQAENISVAPLADYRKEDLIEKEFLAGLPRGLQAKVLGLSPACRGAERRRLLDLGFVPGTDVEVEMVSPAGDPTAYRVRGTLVALRREQANLIRITAPQARAA